MHERSTDLDDRRTACRSHAEAGPPFRSSPPTRPSPWPATWRRSLPPGPRSATPTACCRRARSTGCRPQGCWRSPSPPRTAAPTSRCRRWPRSSGSSPPATRASPRCRTATSSTSTPCAIRATPPSRRSSSARCSPASGSATRSPRSAASTCGTTATTAAPGRTPRPVAAGGRQGLRHRRAVRRLDPRARPPRHPARRIGGPLHVAWVERTAPGVTVVDDWNGMGQRTTASGTVRLESVDVPEDRITAYHLTFEGPQTYGAFAQVLHAALDAGIARAALDRRRRVRDHEEPALPRRRGRARRRGPPRRPRVRRDGARRARRRGPARRGRPGGRPRRRRPDGRRPAPTPRSRSPRPARPPRQASVDAASRLFEVAGTRSALDSLNLNRHWRNARTHTLHDPAAWKVQHLGRWAVDGTLPPNHGQL